VTDLLEEVRLETRALSSLVAQASALWPKVSAALAATCDDVERRLAGKQLTIVVAGAESKRVLEVGLGRPLFDGPLPERAAIFVRRAEEPGFVARFTDGTAEDFSEITRARAAKLTKMVDDAEREATEARETVARLTAELEVLREQRSVRRRSMATLTPRHPSLLDKARIFFRALLETILRLLGRAPRELAPPSPDDLGPVFAIERELVDAEPKAERTRIAFERALQERAERLAERRRELDDALAALADCDTEEIVVEHPSELLSDDIVLAYVPLLDDEEQRRRIRKDLGGAIVVARDEAAATTLRERLSPVLPYAVDTTQDADLGTRMRAVLDQLRRESPLVVAALAVADVRARLGSLAEASAKAEADCRERIESFERAKLPEPAQFRQEQLERLQAAIDESARRVITRANEVLHTKIVALGDEWAESILGAADRSKVIERIHAIDAEAEARIDAIVEEVTDQIGTTIQTTSETMQRWVLGEVRAQYTSRASRVDSASIVVTEVPKSERSWPRAAVAGAISTASLKRAGVGVAGAAAGAAIGTLVLPGIGTAVGALVGVLGAFAPGIDGIRRDACTRLRTSLEIVERDVTARLEAGFDGFVRDMRIAVDETMDAALRRREESILRLIDIEGKALAKEQRTLEDLTSIRTALDKHERRFAELAGKASQNLVDQAASRPRGPMRTVPL
jgi:hypothetical protein